MSSSIDDGRAILLIGAAGQLGGEFVRQFRQHRVPVVITTSQASDQANYEPTHPVSSNSRINDDVSWRRLDVSVKESLVRLINEVQPRVIINASAYTAVDNAETDQTLANAVNATAPRIMAEACAANGAMLVHFSTDYVFDGRSERGYSEQDVPRPLNEYGRSKLRGEQAVLAPHEGHFVFRTSWLYTPGGRNFVTTMLRLLHGESPVRVVDDQYGCPTWARDVAAAITNWLVQTPPRELKQNAGLYHLCSTGHCSWYEFARAIRERMMPRPTADLLAIDTAAFGSVTARPARSVLDCTRARDALKLQLPDWRDALDAAMPAFNDAV